MQLTIQINYIAYILTATLSIVIAFVVLCILEWLWNKLKEKSMLIDINELDTLLEAEGTFDVIVTNIADKDTGFSMTMKTKDGRVVSDMVTISPTTKKFVSRLANLAGLYKSPIDSKDFIGRYFTVQVRKYVNGTTKYNICHYDKCAEPFTIKE